VRRNFGSIAYNANAIAAARARASPRGKAPSVFSTVHTAAYSSHSRIRLR
jgi:hypothetical protein